MNVVDIGCCDWGTSVSIEPLIERFKPSRLWGFDPYPHMGEKQWTHDGCLVTTTRAAAWTYDGVITFERDTTGSKISPDGRDLVQCFDLGHYLLGMPEPVILKLDCEGAEHTLIPHLTSLGAWKNVGLLLVEFHGDEPRATDIPVEWEEWT